MHRAVTLKISLSLSYLLGRLIGEVNLLLGRVEHLPVSTLELLHQLRTMECAIYPVHFFCYKHCYYAAAGLYFYSSIRRQGGNVETVENGARGRAKLQVHRVRSLRTVINRGGIGNPASCAPVNRPLNAHLREFNRLQRRAIIFN